MSWWRLFLRWTTSSRATSKRAENARRARAHAEIWARLEANGALIGAHDLWIAATALAHGMRVATVNARHFERVPGLDVLAVS